MALTAAFQMDPIEAVDIDGDTSFDMAFVGQTRGHDIWVYDPRDLVFAPPSARVAARRVRLAREKGDHVAFLTSETRDLRSFDVIFMRQDPPFDMAYITATHVLESVHPETLVVNDPAAVRNAPEKLLVTAFADITPPTLISRSTEAISEFRSAHGDIILKPLFGNGGAGVFRLQAGDPNFSSLLEMFFERSLEPIIAQAYVPDVKNGDKRVLLVDGEPVGAINRVPPEGETRSNMHVGGRPEPSDLTARDRELCAAIGPTLRARGLTLAGIDVIGDYLTEINVTSPTGVQELRRFSGLDVSERLWGWVEAQRGA
ncbi:MAG: glutathione synthase [Pseudomonadota bacterium]